MSSSEGLDTVQRPLKDELAKAGCRLFVRLDELDFFGCQTE